MPEVVASGAGKGDPVPQPSNEVDGVEELLFQLDEGGRGGVLWLGVC